MKYLSEYLDKWIESIPENPYNLCPCGCGMKWKFNQGERAEHEKRFIEKLKKESEKSCFQA